jgi:hypothetical protein
MPGEVPVGYGNNRCRHFTPPSTAGEMPVFTQRLSGRLVQDVITLSGAGAV